MEKLICDIESYAAAVGRKPQTVLRLAVGSGWGIWALWREGSSSPTIAVADRIYRYMAENPPEQGDRTEKGEEE